MKIVILGAAEAFDRETEEVIVDSRRLSELDGLTYTEDSCGEYLDESLYEIGIIGGQIELAYQATDSKLQVLTTYHAPRKLKKTELQLLIDETAGQWSDGIGEGEFQHAEELGIDVDISPFDSEPTVEQIDDGVVVRKPRKNELIKLLQDRSIDEEAALALVKSGAAVDAKDRYGETVLELACRAVLPDLVALLLRRGALEKAEDRNRTLSTLVLCYGSDDVLEDSVRIAEQLVENGVDVEAIDDEGRTPLMMAANRNNLPLVKFLLSKGADVNAQDAKDANRLSVLMYAQHPEMVQYLLENGADPSIRTAYGENAYEVQLRNSHQKHYQEMAEMLKHHLK